MSDADEAVCGFTFNNEGETCNGNTYGMKTFESRSDAENAGANVTHLGACGVCSSAQDLAVMGKKSDEISSEFQSCGTKFFTKAFVLPNGDVNTEFGTLVSCISELGYTDDCGLLWAYQVAVSAALCTDECSKGEPFYGAPPACELSGCLKCAAEKEGFAFNKLAGRTFLNSGIRDTIVRPCKDFASIVHDPQCDLAQPDPDQTPTQPVTERSAGVSASARMYVLVVIVSSLVMRF
eukprot:CAMPEP_0197464492 /NCGR_PEP_ID=MMETSP1175-20131217/64050_1 /TAXON_ID=1003142 /ORGANISM="Triceratium dubium, Strain CCMP147" /LENGTH=235 /DNA_ID=CAMNT_0043000473 /DNA_START=379 /DNA_END=1086 /DNA_ORIENTATION=+